MIYDLGIPRTLAPGASYQLPSQYGAKANPKAGFWQ